MKIEYSDIVLLNCILHVLAGWSRRKTRRQGKIESPCSAGMEYICGTGASILFISSYFRKNLIIFSCCFR